MPDARCWRWRVILLPLLALGVSGTFSLLLSRAGFGTSGGQYNGAEMTGRTVETSPQLYARMAGAFGLLEALTAAFGQVILPKLVVSGDAAATAANILRNQPLFLYAFAATVIGVLFHLARMLLFYELFKPVNRSIALLAVFGMLVGCAFQALTGLLYLAPVRVLTAGSALSAFTTEQLQALALVFLKVNALAFDIYLVFFGFWCALTGYLIFRSTFLPRILGVLLLIDGFGWMTFLSADLGRYLMPGIFIATALAELPLMVWLIVKGVDVRRWKQQAGVLLSRQT